MAASAAALGIDAVQYQGASKNAGKSTTGLSPGKGSHYQLVAILPQGHALRRWALVAWNAFRLYCLGSGRRAAPRPRAQPRRSSLTSR